MQNLIQFCQCLRSEFETSTNQIKVITITASASLFRLIVVVRMIKEIRRKLIGNVAGTRNIRTAQFH
jgi:hypothetical protein